jgi:phosphate starvation-inducible protein PhoH and related proteins
MKKETKPAEAPQPKIKPKTKGQYRLFREFENLNKQVILISGKPGTGKTFTAAYFAIKGLLDGTYDKIFITRPAVEACGEKFGFLKGGLEEKIYPYLIPIYEEMEGFLSPGAIEKLKAEKKINIAPLAFMRGRNLKKAFVILDEAQNVSTEQFKMILTRLHEDSRIVICGDFQQSDLRNRDYTDFEFICDRLYNLPFVTHIQLGDEDILRSKNITEILNALCN